MRNLKLLTKQNGITLIEVLAVLIITFIIGSILFSVVIQGKGQYQNQSQTNRDLTDISYGLKVFTKDIRRAQIVESFSTDTVSLNYENTNTCEIESCTILKYDDESHKIYKNSTEYLTNVEHFSFIVDEGGKVIQLEIKLKNSSNEVYTEIFTRGENY